MRRMRLHNDMRALLAISSETQPLSPFPFTFFSLFLFVPFPLLFPFLFPFHFPLSLILFYSLFPFIFPFFLPFSLILFFVPPFSFSPFSPFPLILFLFPFPFPLFPSPSLPTILPFGNPRLAHFSGLPPPDFCTPQLQEHACLSTGSFSFQLPPATKQAGKKNKKKKTRWVRLL